MNSTKNKLNNNKNKLNNKKNWFFKPMPNATQICNLTYFNIIYLFVPQFESIRGEEGIQYITGDS